MEGKEGATMSNDSIYSPTYLGLVSQNYSFRDSVDGFFDLRDYFYFQSGVTGSLTVTLSGLTADLDLGIYNASGVLLDSSTLYGFSSETVTVSSVSSFDGFYIQVEPYLGASSSYTLSITFTASPPYIYDYPSFADIATSGGSNLTYGWHLDEVFAGYYLGWGVGWSVGWNVGWNVGYYYGWGYTWYVNSSGDWEAGYAVGWSYGWNVGWNYGWFHGWNYGWQPYYTQAWDLGYYFA